MRNIRLVISYDGSLFYGSQSQEGKKTVQGSIEEAIFKLTGEDVKLSFAGRTDRGVHALAQVANFSTKSSIPADRFYQAINTKLINGVRVIGSNEVPLGFDSRRSAKSREYVYLIYIGKDLPVFLWHKALHIRDTLSINKMSLASKALTGRHDFKGYSAAGSSAKSTIRKIKKISFHKVKNDLFGQGYLLRIKIVADGFLYKMVRFIVAALLDVGSEKIDIKEIKNRLREDKYKESRKVVSPCGLYLSEVKY